MAWSSLAVQVSLLLGSRGLLPVAPLVASLRALDRPVWHSFPSFLLVDASDATLTAGVVLGIALSLLALVGVWPRLCLLLSAPLYLGYVVAGRDFLSFQWDNLLVECLVLASFVPRDRASPASHWVQRALLFKLYFESGIAKAQSHLGDWLDGSAMTFYYETAPLPAWPAWWAHQLPEAWHILESWGALGLETGGALLILGPRRARLTALVAFTGFQALNLATANYGFFVYLALALHVFLLDDSDLERISARLPGLPGLPGLPRALRRIASAAKRAAIPEAIRPYTRVGAGILAGVWLLASTVAGVAHLGPGGEVSEAAARWTRTTRPFRVANAYHLFGHITRERIEPEFQTLLSGAGADWQVHDLHYKPGDPMRAPPFVAPHQPRIDFLLWFYGLDFQRGAPRYVTTLLERMCTDPEAVADLFDGPLPDAPAAVRIAYWQYRFATPEEHARSGAWWQRERRGETAPIPCDRFASASSGRP